MAEKDWVVLCRGLLSSVDRASNAIGEIEEQLWGVDGPGGQEIRAAVRGVYGALGALNSALESEIAWAQRERELRALEVVGGE